MANSKHDPSQYEVPSESTRRREEFDAGYDGQNTHVYWDGKAVCRTDTRGDPEPGGRSPLELVVDATEGFIPLWDESVTLRWRFQEQSMGIFVDPQQAKIYLRNLFGTSLLLWGEEALPVHFTEAHDAWDFEIAVNAQTDCTPAGCTLARAFFPDAGRHDLLIYPSMFDQSWQEQVETMAHELGHVFGLRHFFALIHESAWPSEVFGTHQKFSIMNYGDNSFMTDNDRTDLEALYQAVWSGDLTAINGTPVQLQRPFSASRPEPACVPVAARSPATASVLAQRIGRLAQPRS